MYHCCLFMAELVVLHSYTIHSVKSNFPEDIYFEFPENVSISELIIDTPTVSTTRYSYRWLSYPERHNILSGTIFRKAVLEMNFMDKLVSVTIYVKLSRSKTHDQVIKSFGSEPKPEKNTKKFLGMFNTGK